MAAIGRFARVGVPGDGSPDFSGLGVFDDVDEELSHSAVKDGADVFIDIFFLAVVVEGAAEFVLSSGFLEEGLDGGFEAELVQCAIGDLGGEVASEFDGVVDVVENFAERFGDFSTFSGKTNF